MYVCVGVCVLFNVSHTIFKVCPRPTELVFFFIIIMIFFFEKKNILNSGSRPHLVSAVYSDCNVVYVGCRLTISGWSNK